MKNKLKNFIKFNKHARMLFVRAGSSIISLFGHIIPMNDKRILFLSFGGRQFSDSPRALFDYISQDPFFVNYELVWAFNNPNDYADLRCKKIKTDTVEYFKYALSSKIWITNTSICRGLQFKKKNNVCVNTWHGTPLKKMGYSLDPNPKFKEIIDIGCCQNEMDRAIFLRLFNVDEKNILNCDLPRNDELTRYNPERICSIKKELGVPENKKVLLYMPTYRDYNLDKYNNNFFLPPVDFIKWEEMLKDEYVLIVRFHYLIEKMINIPKTNFFFNATHYDKLNDLYAIADILISDYSSSFIDYSILERPMLCFGYDFEEYKAWRGFELDFENSMPCSIDRNENDLLEHIKSLDYEDARLKAVEFHKKYSAYAGNATETIVDFLKTKLSVI